MKRIGPLGCCLAMMVGVFAAVPAQADHLAGLGATLIETFQVPADGGLAGLPVGAGVYSVTLTGTYIYDIDFAPGLVADAECSVDSPRYDGVVDQVAHAAGLYPTPLSEWQRFRYGVNVQPGVPPVDSFTDNPFDDTLDVYIDEGFGFRLVDWLPLAPTPSDGSGVVAGCDVATHKYETVVVSLGGSITLRIFDVEYTDNLGFLTAQIHRIL